MEAAPPYDRFSLLDSDSMRRGCNKVSLCTQISQTCRFYIMFGVLAAFLLLLTLTVGIKITQVNQKVSDLASSLKMISQTERQTDTSSYYKPAVPLPVRGSCANNWYFYEKKCYYLSTQSMNWHNAEKNCVLRRGHLMVVNNREEMEYISQIVEDHLQYWIGLVEKEGEATWSWVDGTDFNSTEHFWDEGQPDDWDYRVNGEDCGQIHHRVSFKISYRLWNDADCTLKYPYVCERPA